MPLDLVTASVVVVFLHLALIGHARQRNPGKGWVPILLIPVIGAIAYLAAEIVFPPLGRRWAGTPVQQAARQAEQRRLTLWPSRKSHKATPVEERIKLAQACLARGEPATARDLLEGCLIYGARPDLLRLLAQARLALDDPAGAVKALERLQRAFPGVVDAEDLSLLAKAQEDSRSKAGR